MTIRKLARIQAVDAVEPIPGADAVMKIRVLGGWIVAKKGEHRPGDKLDYREIDSLLPERPDFEFLRARSCKPAQVDPAEEAADVTEHLGVLKWEPLAPAGDRRPSDRGAARRIR